MKWTRTFAGAVTMLWFAQVAACGSSLFPPIEFPDPPSRWANDPTGAVVLESVTTIALRAPVPEQGPRAPARGAFHCPELQASARRRTNSPVR